MKNAQKMQSVGELNAVTPEALRRESTWALYAASVARALPEPLKMIAFASPVCAREPESEDVWHEGHWSSRGVAAFAISRARPMARAFLALGRRLLTRSFGYAEILERPDARVLCVGPDTVVTIQDGRIKTSYAAPEDVASMSFIVWHDRGRAAQSISRRFVLRCLAQAAWAWARTFFDARWRTVHGLTARLLMAEWMVSGRWMGLLQLDAELRAALRRLKPLRVAALHEMHPYARVVWRVASELGIATRAIQHASIVRAKLWYFAYPEEWNDGLCAPTELVVYDASIAALMRPWVPATTTMTMACGPRFAHLRGAAMRTHEPARPCALCVTSLAWWDVKVVLEAATRLRALMESGWLVAVRLHPAAVLTRRTRRRLAQLVRAGVELSTRPLQDDLVRASVVVGFNSTMLDEAAALGIPACTITSSQWMSFAGPITPRIALDASFCESVRRMAEMTAAERQRLRALTRQYFGLDLPVARIADAMM